MGVVDRGSPGNLRRPGLVVVLALAVTGCALGWPQPERPATDTAPEPIGPVVEIGRGVDTGITWRYSIYESTMGMCTRVDMDGRDGGSSCGFEFGVQPPGAAIGLMSAGASTGMPSQVDGFASDEVAAVWIETDAGRVPATLMSLGPAGIDGQIFHVFVPGDRSVDEAVAVDAGGAELGRVTIDLP